MEDTMTKYIDADKLKRFVKSIGLTPQKSADYNDGRDDVKMMVLDFIDSLQQEQPEVDLEKEIEEYFPESAFYTGWNYDDMQEVARHFAQWGAEHLKK
jgi:hypothetical protein